MGGVVEHDGPDRAQGRIAADIDIRSRARRDAVIEDVPAGGDGEIPGDVEIAERDGPGLGQGHGGGACRDRAGDGIARVVEHDGAGGDDRQVSGRDQRCCLRDGCGGRDVDARSVRISAVKSNVSTSRGQGQCICGQAIDRDVSASASRKSNRCIAAQILRVHRERSDGCRSGEVRGDEREGSRVER